MWLIVSDVWLMGHLLCINFPSAAYSVQHALNREACDRERALNCRLHQLLMSLGYHFRLFRLFFVDVFSDHVKGYLWLRLIIILKK